MDKYLHTIRRKAAHLLHFSIIAVVLAIISAIPLIYSWGKINLGFDTFLPFIPENSYKLAYQWTDRANGIYTLNLYFVWIFFLDTMQKIGLDLYRAASAMQFCIFFFSGLGIYKMFNLFNKGSRYVALVPAIFFIYSPFMLDFMLYQFGIIGIVWSIYFFLKFIVRKKLTFLDAVFTSLALATIIDLPNPKYHFMIFVSFAMIFLAGFILKLINWSDVRKNASYFIGLLLTSSYLSVPFLVFGYAFANFSGVLIAIKKDYALTGETIDFGVALIHKMIRLFHTPNLNPSSQKFLEEPLLFFSYYALPLLVLGVFPLIFLKKSTQDKKRYLLLYLMALFFIFLSKGANPPFGILYEAMLAPQILSFLRTTAGFVVYAAVFYSLIFGLIYQHFLNASKSKIATTLLFSIFIGIWGFHIWLGHMFFNHSERYFDTAQHGITIPKDYFNAAERIADRQLDAKVDVYPAVEGYTDNSWGYYGITYYPWLMKQPAIHFEKNSYEGRVMSAVNVGYILHDKSSTSHENTQYSIPDFPKLFSTSLLDLYEVPLSHIIPHIYIPSQTVATDKIPSSYLNKGAQHSSLTAYFSLTNKPDTLLTIPKTIQKKPRVIYKKIDPTKYRVRVLNASSVFPLVFLENFHALWKLYLNPEFSKDHTNIPKDRYVSHNMHGTVQNDNLLTGSFYETLFLPEADTHHLKVNGFFNAWLIDPRLNCSRGGFCKRNDDGSYDMEFVIEFLPQRIANICLFISLFSVASYGLYRLVRLKNKKAL